MKEERKPAEAGPQLKVITSNSRSKADDKKSLRTPHIDASDQNLNRVTRKAAKALQESNDPPTLFNHGEILSRLERERSTGKMTFKELTVERLRFEMASRIYWFTWDDGKKVPARPPVDVAKNLLAAPDPALPVLKRLAEVPIFAPDGQLISEPGYHYDSGIFLAPVRCLDGLEVPKSPKAEDLKWAKEQLLCELASRRFFPLVGDSDRAHAVAMLLLPFVREIIRGPTPNHLMKRQDPARVRTCWSMLFWPSLW